jgi:predicted O-methyltransferase YrrM
MHGTPIKKIARLVTSLLMRPQDVPRYLSMRKIPPLDLELPWFSFAAIDFLDAYLKPTMRVFEYGSGGSTLFFAERAALVVSTEDNRVWLDRVAQATEACRNVTLQHRPITWVEGTFEQSAYLHSIPGEFDVIVVDGIGWDIDPFRLPCFLHAERFIAPGGIIVVDDSWRYPELRQRTKAKAWREFRSTGPYRPGVTTTEVHFY